MATKHDLRKILTLMELRVLWSLLWTTKDVVNNTYVVFIAHKRNQFDAAANIGTMLYCDVTFFRNFWIRLTTSRATPSDNKDWSGVTSNRIRTLERNAYITTDANQDRFSLMVVCCEYIPKGLGGSAGFFTQNSYCRSPDRLQSCVSEATWTTTTLNRRSQNDTCTGLTWSSIHNSKSFHENLGEVDSSKSQFFNFA